VGETWIWQAIASKSKFLLGEVVGNRTLKEALELLGKVKNIRGKYNGRDILFLSDNLNTYKKALVSLFGYQLKKYKHRDSYQFAKYKIPQNINYAVVEKTRNSRGNIIMTKPRIVFGTKKKAMKILKSYFKNQKVNISFIERYNLTNRQHNAKIGRKTISYAKDINSLKYQMILARTYYNFCLPHDSLKISVGKYFPGKKYWLKRTPAMAENITEHIWSFEELIFFYP